MVHRMFDAAKNRKVETFKIFRLADILRIFKALIRLKNIISILQFIFLAVYYVAYKIVDGVRVKYLRMKCAKAYNG